MGNYENLKQSITEVIRTNGNQEITGAVLQSTLLTIISTVGANAKFAGIATPTTNPGTPDGPVFYLASESGTYSNFGSIELQDGLSVLMWNGSWSSQQIFSIDDEPTAGSDNLVKSGGVTKIYGKYIENPEFVRVYTDAEDKILLGIKKDGSIYYGAGVPQQVIDYIEQKIADLSLDEYEDIVAFLNGLAEGDKTLQMLLNEKVDKEEGKSLINDEYAEGVRYIESQKFIETKLDAKKRILEATYKDGTKLLPAGAKIVGTAEYDGATTMAVENSEFIYVKTDAEGKILCGIKKNGVGHFPGGIIVKNITVEDKNDNIVALNPKADYYIPQMSRPSRESNVVKGIPLILAHFSDLHGDSVELGRILDFCKKYNSYIDDILCTGDIVVNYFTDNISFWKADNKVLLTIGNHETYGSGYTTQYTSKECYDKFISPFINNWNVSQPDNAETNGYNYWYKDYSAQKIRLIGLDCMFFDATQSTWLDDVLEDAKTNGLSVIVASHYMGGLMTPLNTTFDDSIQGIVPTYINQQAPTKIQNFIDNGGEFICWFSGHTHMDYFGYLTNFPSQLCLVIDTSHRGYQSVYSTCQRVIGTKSEDLFNILGFDTYSKVIKVYRIGADKDSFMRTKESLCVNYINKNIISNN